MKLKKNKKIKWIKNKYYKKDKIPDIIEGIVVKDQEVGEEFQMRATTYGGIQLTSDEESVTFIVLLVIVPGRRPLRRVMNH